MIGIACFPFGLASRCFWTIMASPNPWTSWLLVQFVWQYSTVLTVGSSETIRDPYGYGSIPIHTIFRGMNIHLPAILMFTRGIGSWPIPISQDGCRMMQAFRDAFQSWQILTVDICASGQVQRTLEFARAGWAAWSCSDADVTWWIDLVLLNILNVIHSGAPIFACLIYIRRWIPRPSVACFVLVSLCLFELLICQNQPGRCAMHFQQRTLKYTRTIQIATTKQSAPVMKVLFGPACLSGRTVRSYHAQWRWVILPSHLASKSSKLRPLCENVGSSGCLAIMESDRKSKSGVHSG